MDFDEKEKAMEEKVVNQFARYEKPETCPMCEIHKLYEKKLGTVKSEEMFLSTFKEREHDQMICFMDSYVFCTAQEIKNLPSEVLRKMAISQYDAVVNFVKWKGSQK